MQILESWCYTDVVHTNMMGWDEGRLTKDYHNLKQEKKNCAKEVYCSTRSWYKGCKTHFPNFTQVAMNQLQDRWQSLRL